MSGQSINYLRMVYTFHVLIVALPLLYIGIVGQITGQLPPFAYTYLTLLGGMALVYHAFWLIYSFITRRVM